MLGPALSLGLLAALPCGASAASEEPAAAIHAQIEVAQARAAFARGDYPEAQDCLDSALRRAPSSTIALRARAQLHLRTGALEAAAVDAERAFDLGDIDAELLELRAVVAAERGLVADARRLSARAKSWPGDLIGVSLDAPDAVFRSSGDLGEPSSRGALAALVLAAHEARQGRWAEARGLVDRAAQDARRSGDLELVRRTALARRDLATNPGVRWWAQAATHVDYSTNPTYVSSANERIATVRAGASGRVGADLSLGRLRVKAAMDVLQHALLMERDELCCLDVFAYRIGGALSVPIGADPRGVRVGLVARWTDVFADRFRFHHAAHLEGGPTLQLRLGARLTLDLAFLGVLTDFVDVSPSDASASALNRDRVGQRATLGLRFELPWIDLRVETVFFSDDADGDAFDAIGGSVAAWIEARPQDELTFFLGGSLAARDWGPVGDRSVIGSASTRADLRAALRVGVRLALYGPIELLLQDTLVDNTARAGHDYTVNVLSMGVQTRW